jgi:hypothetical protein
MPATPVYDSTVEAKYHGIQQELESTVRQTTVPGIDSPTCGYSMSSVHEICHMMYQTELRRAFYQTDVSRPFSVTMDNIHVLYTTMMSNSAFSSFISDMTATRPDRGEYVFTLCFCYDLFYEIHPVICQYLTTGAILPSAIQHLHQRAASVLSNAIEADVFANGGGDGV